MSALSPKTVSVILTIKDDPEGCAQTLHSLTAQTRQPEAIIVVDGGSTDGTMVTLQRLVEENPKIQWIQAPGANIARGRNIATKAASTDIVACTDGGCHAEPDWLENLVKPFERNRNAEFVGGLYRIEPNGLFEKVVGLATMRGQLERVDPRTFNPSGRSMAYAKSLWDRAGGWPEWLSYSEDTLFDVKLRGMGIACHVAEGAVVRWRPRTTWRDIARQFYNYGTGRGHTRIGQEDFVYHLRSLILVCMAFAFSCLDSRILPIALILAVYFLGWAFHDRAAQVLRHVRTSTMDGFGQRTPWRRAYFVAQLVLLTVCVSGTLGFVVGAWQRWRDRERFDRALFRYMEGCPNLGATSCGSRPVRNKFFRWLQAIGLSTIRRSPCAPIATSNQSDVVATELQPSA
jgi:cellulose synthase/poly-beta-1,6-N-acetylglucosamine synthase-like glycosyltransferase